ncbi:50S ribosomal protein L5 [bacterium]|nr:50S ribosomal protein L5 [bacterium]
MARLTDKYKTEVIPALKKRFGYSNVHQIPKLEKVVLSMGVGEAVQNQKLIDSAVADLTAITGQKAVIKRSKKSIANFKLRAGLPIGTAVTLRKERMYEFLDRFISTALPRVRDFKGIPANSFDGHGNYSMGLTEQLVFPEIDTEKTTIRGLNITVVTTAKNNEEGKALLEELGFPFRK